jgi:hypothetical protein
MKREEWMAREEDIDKRASPLYPYFLLGSYPVQMFLVFAAPLLWQELVDGIEMRGIRVEPLGGLGFQVANGLWIGVIGLALGVGVQYCIRGAVSTGRWVWVPPVALFLYGVCSDYMKFGLHRVLLEFFFWSHPGRDEGPILREFLTYPTWTSIWYSLGMHLVARRQAAPTKHRDEA